MFAHGSQCFRVLVAAVAGNVTPLDLHFFRSYPSPEDTLLPNQTNVHSNPENQLIWEAARASSAAPTYFRFQINNLNQLFINEMHY